jgi:hypothetical protein
MKTTIKLTTSKAMTVQPCKTGGVILEVNNLPVLAPVMLGLSDEKPSNITIKLTPDQVGALIFALEMCIEGSPETLNDRG